MIRLAANRWATVGCFAYLVWFGADRLARADDLPAPRPVEQPVQVLSRPDAVLWALEHNPTLAPIRQQRGIAEAGTVIAQTYPFNPVWQNFSWYGNGPAAAGVTNHLFNENTFRLDLELHHQGKHRQDWAQATLSRTDWEIAFQEALLAVRVLRAFNTVRYRQEKLRLVDETIQLNEQAVEQFRRLAEQNRLPRADLMLAQMDVADARSLRAPAQGALTASWQQLRRELGAVDECLDITGPLDLPPPPCDPNLTQLALQSRADLHARQSAVGEAEARLRLEIANKCGNPSVGPATEINETSVTFVGTWLLYSVPLFNRRQGDILQRKAELGQAALFVRQFEVQIEQDVQTALLRLRDAAKWAGSIRDDVLPELRKTREGLEKLFAAGEPGVDVPRITDIRRRVLRTRDIYLDALWELTQAEADLAAAVGDPRFAAFPGGCAPAPPPVETPP